MTYLDTKKVLKGRQVDMSFGLAWLCWATNTEEIIFNGLTELQEILHSEWQSSVSTKPKLVDMEDSHGSAVQWNKHCNPPPEQSRIHLEIYTVRRQFTGTLWNLWMASYSTGPAKSSRLRWNCTCTRCGHYEPLESRILGYCNHGNHKAAVINAAHWQKDIHWRSVISKLGMNRELENWRMSCLTCLITLGMRGAMAENLV